MSASVAWTLKDPHRYIELGFSWAPRCGRGTHAGNMHEWDAACWLHRDHHEWLPSAVQTIPYGEHGSRVTAARGGGYNARSASHF